MDQLVTKSDRLFGSPSQLLRCFSKQFSEDGLSSQLELSTSRELSPSSWLLLRASPFVPTFLKHPNLPF